MLAGAQLENQASRRVLYPL